MAASKGMPLLAGIAAIMIVTYTVFRLQYAANNLPYDPGQPFPATDVAAEPHAGLGARLRGAFLSQHSARVVSATGAPTTDAAWPLFGLERERAMRLLDERIDAAQETPTEQRNSDTCQQLATAVAARKLIETDGVFVLEGELSALQPEGDWRYWSILLFKTRDRRRILHVPIDLLQFPFVRDAATADPRTFDPR